MTDYMKLTDILMDELPEENPWNGNIKGLVEKLIANGVTFAEDNNVPSNWIPVTERMPTDDDADHNGAIIGNHYLFGVRVVCLDNIEKRPAHYTHWMPLPEPPKEVE